ncbi:bacteriophage abortive infection AbiH family protein [Bacillus cereus]|uniref:bacteriophage abortive infection AbiH family protein n=1 Tax=Bacillus cereus TaxID=1396 RepID=UPI002AC0A4B4|nr:bacteriophage abortive infection AbiH family protein [Bacillus cereus]MDZ4417014.1 bacteriophage abortive infection AbiH family protein [Bacillus cereus]
MDLFIIGNGFDLGHGLQTRYWNFLCYLEEHRGNFLWDFEEKYSLWGEGLQTYLWNDLEYNLANIDDIVLTEQMLQSTDLGLESGNVGIEDNLNHYFKVEFKYIEELTIYLKEWIEVVNKELDGINRRTSLINESHQDIFINFNYTTTLEDIYNISSSSVLHIHGVVDSDDELVLGHSNSSRIDYFNENYNDYQNQFDEQRAPIYKVLTDYCSKTYKDVNNYIDQLFSSNFDAVERVIIIGNSLGEVDLPYFKEVKENTEWHVYYYGENEIKNFRGKLTQIGIIEQYIKFIHCDTFYDIP